MHELYLLNRRDKRRREHWHQLIKAFELSGLNQNIFCEQQGIKQEDLQRWIFKLQSNEQQDKSNRPLLNFVPVKIAEAVSPAKVKSSHNAVIKLHHQSGFYFNITEDFDEALLQKVMQLLAGLS